MMFYSTVRQSLLIVFLYWLTCDAVLVDIGICRTDAIEH